MTRHTKTTRDRQLAALAATQTERCLGCGTAVTDETRHHHQYRSYDGRPSWCDGRYGTGQRVDYDLWHGLVAYGGLADRSYFNTWACAEPMRGVPSWFSPGDLR